MRLHVCDRSKHVQVCADFSSVWSGSASFAQGVGIGACLSPVRLPRISLSIARLFAFLPRPPLRAGTNQVRIVGARLLRILHPSTDEHADELRCGTSFFIRCSCRDLGTSHRRYNDTGICR